jgi:protein-glutamine gamma-glutamyltransferase
MRFGVVHRVFLDLLAILGLVAIATTNELGRLQTGLLLVTTVGCLLLPSRLQESLWTRRLSVLLPFALFAIQLLRMLRGSSMLTVSVEFAVAMQIIRLATRRGASHDQQIIALALLHLIAATVLGGGLSYAVCLAGFILVAPPTLVLSHLRREVEGNYRQGARDRTGLPVDVPRILRSRRVVGRGFLAFVCSLSLPVFLFTGALFVAFPRVGLSLLLLSNPRPARMVGFSDRVELGGVGRLQTDSTLVMRLTYPDLPKVPPPRLSVYLRGTAFDSYDGRSWSRSRTRRTPLEHVGLTFEVSRLPDPVRDPSFVVDLAPFDPPALFVPLDTVAIELLPHQSSLLGVLPMVLLGPEGEYRYTKTDEMGGPRYRVYRSAPAARTVPPTPGGPSSLYLALPATLSPRITELAASWAGIESDPKRLAVLFEHRLRTDYRYDLESPSGATSDPLEDFLLHSKRGHCEYFSTAMAVMLRTQGVLTRNVAGFGSGAFNRFGNFYAVRQSDAHSWVEVWIDQDGWTRFDPTPASLNLGANTGIAWLHTLREVLEATSQKWNRHVEGYDLRQQLDLASTLRQATRHLPSSLAVHLDRATGYWIGLTLVAVVLGWLLRQRRRHRPLWKTTKREPRPDEIVEVYRKLEGAMREVGVPRHPGTPPLAHAQGLAALAHPLADDVLEVTQSYLKVRFGGQPLSGELRTSLVRRFQSIRETSRMLTRRPPGHNHFGVGKGGSPITNL